MEPNTLNLPVLALRGLTVFPSYEPDTLTWSAVFPSRRWKSPWRSGQEIFLVTQREI